MRQNSDVLYDTKIITDSESIDCKELFHTTENQLKEAHTLMSIYKRQISLKLRAKNLSTTFIGKNHQGILDSLAIIKKKKKNFSLKKLDKIENILEHYENILQLKLEAENICTLFLDDADTAAVNNLVQSTQIFSKQELIKLKTLLASYHDKVAIAKENMKVRIQKQRLEIVKIDISAKITELETLGVSINNFTTTLIMAENDVIKHIQLDKYLDESLNLFKYTTDSSTRFSALKTNPNKTGINNYLKESRALIQDINKSITQLNTLGVNTIKFKNGLQKYHNNISKNTKLNNVLRYYLRFFTSYNECGDIAFLSLKTNPSVKKIKAYINQSQAVDLEQPKQQGLICVPQNKKNDNKLPNNENSGWFDYFSLY